MKQIHYIILFLILNFVGLALGNFFMGDGPNGIWYNSLNKASWTPPGWVFRVVWTLIMICFSIYLSFLFSLRKSKYVTTIYGIALLLNISWNYLFFNQHFTSIALYNLIALALVIIYLFISFGDDELSKMRYLLVPYILWLCIAISLNGYVVLNN
ncbi:TspO/MBR family protein [Winogradskyella sp. KYW1333]|uniref:TspO/MBR family protein n=1 Tax=Winogradskyella sp. KYW1333 TaxID=2282123 RepID=UPI000DF43A76|nr:TspO/MBR family protein [Winogradskyella sp. KYW1333]RCT54710.1 tryptophan-rich sensory protein [Winogradskyella sp. KYW1333]